MSDFEFFHFFFSFFFCYSNGFSLFYRLSQLIHRNIEGKIHPFGIMYFNWVGRKHFEFL